VIRASLIRARFQDPDQRRIGLTGGIATGKSTVGQLLAERFGLPLLDADLFARGALAPGSPAARAVLARYGEPVAVKTVAVKTVAVKTVAAGAGDAIDRAALGRIVFADPVERRWLEQLVHPLVRQRFEAELERLAHAPVVVLMIPLLFEAGLESLCSEVWLVTCRPETQLQRLIGRDGLPEHEARARIAAQWPLARKQALADRTISNDGDPEALEQQLAAALALNP
jgi:dephospho-CoA kinase